ncbi:MAG TPA: CDP-alcohol phosphatidyltransferase family protein [Calditrichaeota bacterium]|nr:CDP-alcohol phosphatidyltransferase family protein [Calditrichota bacterium]
MSKSILPPGLQKHFIELLKPLVSLFKHYNLNPNFFTVLGLIITALGTVLLIWDARLIRLAGLFILLGGVCDIFDGQLARMSGKVTRFGALFDSSIDRYSEVIMFFGIGAFYVGRGDYLLSVVTFSALGGSMMVSYIRARAEALGFEAKVGLMQRPERVVFMGSGALLSLPLFHLSIFHLDKFPITTLELAVWLIAIFANYTAIQRLIHAYKQDNKNQYLEVNK